jgi:(E)-4-hydroxy-3-methylbut-2-enyl-diphosphate synthase
MAESAMEFLRICHEESFGDVLVSMKSSNTIVMVQATRLLVHQMMMENMVYPVHLGVTEAGEGEDGRIKSAVGIGALLADGIGDTIRVSLTEQPEKEIPVAIKLVKHFTESKLHKPDKYPGDKAISKPGSTIPVPPVNPFEYNRRKTSPVLYVGGHYFPVVVSEFLNHPVSQEDLTQIGWVFDKSVNQWKFADRSPDLTYVKHYNSGINYPEKKGILVDYKVWASLKKSTIQPYPLLLSNEYLDLAETITAPHFVLVSYPGLSPDLISELKKDPAVILIIEADNATGCHGQRLFVFELMNHQCDVPVIFKRSYSEHDAEAFQIKSAADLGGLFIDGLGDGIWLSNGDKFDTQKVCSTAFGILQASRSRISSVEYISCPSCGRTNFNIMEVSAKIRERTSHLKGLKIGIMGCIVNGIGEMADADYGYVGSGKGRVTLYKAREIIRKNIPEEEAVDELIRVIKYHGDWHERNHE